MSGFEVVRKLKELGVSVRLKGDSVMLSPRDKVTKLEADIVRTCKPEVLAFLRVNSSDVMIRNREVLRQEKEDDPRCWCGNEAMRFNKHGRPFCNEHWFEGKAEEWTGTDLKQLELLTS